jgi:hypothetical protein
MEITEGSDGPHWDSMSEVSTVMKIQVVFRQQGTPKCWYHISLHSVTTQKWVTWIMAIHSLDVNWKFQLTSKYSGIDCFNIQQLRMSPTAYHDWHACTQR